jgi:ribosome biogenesis GTPase
LLSRPENKGKVKLLAANIDTIVIVTAPLPLLSERLIDCYLVAAEHLKIPPLLLLNKMDLLDEKSRVEIQSRLSCYEKIGYRVIYSSIYLEKGLEQIKNVLIGKIGVLVGVSGVGKSSIIARITNDPAIVIGNMSQAAGLGKHTTTTTRLYHLPDGGHLIDSPGVREFSLGYLTKEQILDGFIEFRPYRGQCQFRNCQHHSEPGCGLLQAMRENNISAERWESYCDILKGNR